MIPNDKSNSYRRTRFGYTVFRQFIVTTKITLRMSLH